MDTIEKKLKDYILSNYRSVREFCLKANLPVSTLATIFERGIKKANINTVIQICDTLQIDVDGLVKNQIVSSKPKQIALPNGFDLCYSVPQKYNALNAAGRKKVDEYIEDLLASGIYIKTEKEEQ